MSKTGFFGREIVDKKLAEWLKERSRSLIIEASMIPLGRLMGGKLSDLLMRGCRRNSKRSPCIKNLLRTQGIG